MLKERREVFPLTFSDKNIDKKIILIQKLIRHFTEDIGLINEGHFTDSIQFAGYGGFEPYYPIFGMIGDRGFLMRAKVTHIEEDGAYMIGTMLSPNGTVKSTLPMISQLELDVGKETDLYFQNQRTPYLSVCIDALLLYPFITQSPLFLPLQN